MAKLALQQIPTFSIAVPPLEMRDTFKLPIKVSNLLNVKTFWLHSKANLNLTQIFNLWGHTVTMTIILNIGPLNDYSEHPCVRSAFPCAYRQCLSGQTSGRSPSTWCHKPPVNVNVNVNGETVTDLGQQD